MVQSFVSMPPKRRLHSSSLQPLVSDYATTPFCVSPRCAGADAQRNAHLDTSARQLRGGWSQGWNSTMGPTVKVQVPGAEWSQGIKEVDFNIMNWFLTGLLLMTITFALIKCFELILYKVNLIKMVLNPQNYFYLPVNFRPLQEMRP